MWKQKGSWISGAQSEKLLWRMLGGSWCRLCPVLLLPPGAWLSFWDVKCNKLMGMARPCSTSARSPVLS